MHYTDQWNGIKIKQFILPSLFICTFAFIFITQFGHKDDNDCWVLWATQLKLNGLSSAYADYSKINYLPLYLYVLKIFGHLFPTDQIAFNIYKLKAFTFLFDIAGILLICSLVKDEVKGLKYLIYGLLNIGYFYNTMIWNQVDGILTFFIFSAFYFAYFKKGFLSMLLFLLGLNFKLQGIIYFPILLAMWWPQLTVKKAIVYCIIFIGMQVIIVYPFLINGSPHNLLRMIYKSVGYNPVLSMNAFNFWHLFIKGNLMEMPDNVKLFFGLSYKNIGLILFAVSSFIVLIPLIIDLIKFQFYKKSFNPNLKLILIMAALVCFVFFYFNTQMHERYIHPAIIFLTALAFLYNLWIPWLLIGLNYTLSLESILHFFNLNHSAYFLFDPFFIAILYTLGLFILFYHWYKALPPRMFVLEK